MSQSPESTPSGSADSALDSTILRLLMEAIPDRIYFKDLQSRFVRVNHAHAQWVGAKSPEEVVGKTDSDFFAPQHARSALAEEQEIIRTGQPVLGVEQHIIKHDGTQAWGSTTKLPWRDASGRIIGTFGLTRDITATKVAEEKLSQERNLLRTIIDNLPSRIFVKDAKSRFLINNQAHLHWIGLERQEDLLGKSAVEVYSGRRIRQILADDSKVLTEGASIISEERSDFGEDGKTHWSLTTKVPLYDVRGNIIGLAGISHDITERKLAEEARLRQAAEMEADVRMAREVQEVFFSRTHPVFPSGVPVEESLLQFAHHYVPSATLGGDFFDIIQISNIRCGLLICDVMGHGVRAGLLTALIRGIVEEICPRGTDPCHVLAEINRGLLPIIRMTGQPVFATVFYGVIDTQENTLTYSNAGHVPPFLLRGTTGAIERLDMEDPEPAAGLMEDFTYSLITCPFQPGDMLLGYTDGLFEACNPEDVMFGEKQLEESVRQGVKLSASRLISQLVEDLAAFTGRNDFDDDVCIFAAKSTDRRP